MKKLFILLIVAFAMAMNADAQSWLNRLKDKAKSKIENRIDGTVDNAMDKGMDKAQDEATDAVKGKKDKKSKDNNEEVETADENPQVATSSDFKRGSVIMFQDDVTAEQVGEFPSKWDMFSGTTEVKTVAGVKAINLTDNAQVQPLIKEQGAYLPEEFTIEYDFYYWPTDKVPGNDVCSSSEHTYYFNGDKKGDFTYSFKKGWNHVALSFNKRALKVYFNDKRVVNLPRVNQPTWLCFQVPFDYINLTFIRNVVIAKGAVALYDRDAQDVSAVEKAIQETGKFVTNNILFDTGKATLKQESMIEIMKVADYMKKNPNVRFEVQGHTDNQGSDKINDPLSQQRAEAIVKALEGLGVDGFNLKAVGKGSHEPVADNSTEAGRAQNRRVVFVKR